MPNRVGVCAHKVSSTPFTTHGSGSRSGERYLEFAAHGALLRAARAAPLWTRASLVGGFNNQRRNLYHALLLAHALNRTLLLPPALSHRLSPHFGQCPTSVSPRAPGSGAAARPRARDRKAPFRRPEVITKRFETAAANQEAIAAKRERRKAPGPLAAASLLRLLDFSNVTDLVRVADLGTFDAANAPSATSKYDCTNTIWTFGSLLPEGAFAASKGCRARDGWRAKGGCACRDARKTLSAGRARDVELLRVGSTFKGFDTEPIRHVPSVLRLQRATLTYAPPFLAVARAAVRSFLARHGAIDPRALTFDYAAMHLRGGDGSFKHHFKASITRAVKDLAAQYAASRKKAKEPQKLPLVLYVASDVGFRHYREFRDGLAKVEALVLKEAGDDDALKTRTAVRVVALKDVVRDAYEALAAATPGLEDGRALSALPDVEMHLDLLLCASARLAFAGTAGSSVSSSVRTLRAFLLAEEDAARRTQARDG